MAKARPAQEAKTYLVTLRKQKGNDSNPVVTVISKKMLIDNRGALLFFDAPNAYNYQGQCCRHAFNAGSWISVVEQ